MIDISKLKVGDKVHYVGKTKHENGIIKSIGEHTEKLFVVYECGNDWENFMNYTGVLTNIKDLKLGWN